LGSRLDAGCRILTFVGFGRAVVDEDAQAARRKAPKIKKIIEKERFI
jgi:hypothetical protein